MDNLAVDITISAPKLSTPSKMPCKTWSLQAYDTCPGKRTSDGMDPVCSDCYAAKGHYNRPATIDVRKHNEKDWKAEGWTAAMVALLHNRKEFRFFDSGDMYSLKLAEKIFEVAKQSPHCKIWIPTRMGRFAKFAPILRRLDRLENVALRHSAFGYDSVLRNRARSSMVYTTPKAPKGVHECPAYKSAAATCRSAGCRACWDKTVKVIGYPSH
jgi:hypothetical protein